jgi:hypothetical protein
VLWLIAILRFLIDASPPFTHKLKKTVEYPAILLISATLTVGNSFTN